MEPWFTVRAAQSADDAEIARIVTDVSPDWPLSTEQIAGATLRRGQRFHRKWVAQLVQGALAGYGFIEVPDVAAAPGRLRIRVVVDPQQAGRGVGAALYRVLESKAAGQGATELVSEALESDPRAAQFALDRGFTVYHRRIESRLKLTDVAPATIARAIDSLTDRWFARDLRIATYRQLAAACDDAPRRLYEINVELWRDVPFGITGDDPSFESFVAEELGDPAFVDEATFVALEGGRWIGLCAHCRGERFLTTTMTGVIRAWRRCGVARWLKLHAIRYALDIEVPEIRTVNDEINASILALNRSLGYRPIETNLRLKKELG
jgi:GNAT superfamily N-acetyltransferase